MAMATLSRVNDKYRKASLLSTDWSAPRNRKKLQAKLDSKFGLGKYQVMAGPKWTGVSPASKTVAAFLVGELGAKLQKDATNPDSFQIVR